MLTITWNTTKQTDHPFKTDEPICTYLCEEGEAAFHLWYTLVKVQKYKWVTVRDLLGNVVDMENQGWKSVISESCFLKIDQEALKMYTEKMLEDYTTDKED